MSIFMQIEGIKGEASDKNYRDWLDIDNFKWDSQRKITSASSTQGSRESSNVTINNLTLRRFMDKATPRLVIAACCGKGKTVKLVQTKTGSGSGGDAFLEYTLHNTLLCGYAVEAIENTIARPREVITLSFTALETKYTAYDDDGNPQSPVIVGFDTTTNSLL